MDYYLMHIHKREDLDKKSMNYRCQSQNTYFILLKLRASDRSMLPSMQTCVWSLELTWWKERTEHQKLSSALHMHDVGILEPDKLLPNHQVHFHEFQMWTEKSGI